MRAVPAVLSMLLALLVAACHGGDHPMVEIPHGTFLMGSPPTEPCRENNEPQHTVTLTRGFAIGAYEVTLREFEEVMGPLRNSYQPKCGSDCPVVNLFANDPLLYCNELSRRAGLELCYQEIDLGQACPDGKEQFCIIPGGSCHRERCIATKVSARFAGDGRTIYDCTGYRLPTEAEWEYAYRAGTTTPYYSDEVVVSDCTGVAAGLEKIGWYAGTGGLHPGGELRPNNWGLYDMAGNASEVVHDCIPSDIATTAVTDPVAEGCRHPALLSRGGSYGAGAGALRAAFRVAGGARGFRVAITR